MEWFIMAHCRCAALRLGPPQRGAGGAMRSLHARIMDDDSASVLDGARETKKGGFHAPVSVMATCTVGWPRANHIQQGTPPQAPPLLETTLPSQHTRPASSSPLFLRWPDAHIMCSKALACVGSIVRMCFEFLSVNTHRRAHASGCGGTCSAVLFLTGPFNSPQSTHPGLQQSSALKLSVNAAPAPPRRNAALGSQEERVAGPIDSSKDRSRVN